MVKEEKENLKTKLKGIVAALPEKPNTFKRTITINNGITTTVRALSNLLNLWSVFLYNSFSYPSNPQIFATKIQVSKQPRGSNK